MIPGTRDYTPQLKKDEIGIVVYPTKFARSNLEDEVSPHNHNKYIGVFLDIICKCASTLLAWQKRNSSLMLDEASSSYECKPDDESKDDADVMTSDAVELQVDDPKIVTSLSFGQVTFCLWNGNHY